MVGRRGRRGRPPKMATPALMAERRRERLQEVKWLTAGGNEPGFVLTALLFFPAGGAV